MRISDWSSDVGSSDLITAVTANQWVLTLRTGIILLVQTHGPWVWAGWASLCLKDRRPRLSTQLERPSSRVVSRSALRFLSSRPEPLTCSDRKSVVKGTSVSVRVDLGGRRIIKTKKTNYN